MKIKVVIEGEFFEVDVEDVYQRPVIATVDGERFEVWPEGENAFQAQQPAPKKSPASPTWNKYFGPGNGKVTAPIPGLIVSVSVQVGDQVSAGQEICVLEAMKMKNTIRSPRTGWIEQVEVASGQQVGQGDVMVTFGET